MFHLLAAITGISAVVFAEVLFFFASGDATACLEAVAARNTQHRAAAAIFASSFINKS